MSRASARMVALLSSLLLAGCWEMAAIDLGSKLVIAGVGAIVDAASDDDSGASTQSASAAVATDHYCKKSGGNQAYITKTGKCIAGDSPITSTQYYSASIEREPSGIEPRALTYCYDSKINLPYTRETDTCGNDLKITKEQYEARRTEREKAKADKVAAAKAYCYVAADQKPYETSTGQCNAGHKKITAEQYASEIAKFQASAADETYCFDKLAGLEYLGRYGKCLGRDVRISADEFEVSKKKRAAESKKPEEPVIPVASPPVAEPKAEQQAALAVQPQPAPVVPIFAVPAIPDSAKAVASGTAFYVSSEGYALTNEHVVNGCKWVALFTGDGIEPAFVVGVDADVDLALLRTVARPETTARFASGPPEVGETSYIVGYPLLTTLAAMNMTDGIVSSLSGPGGYDRVLQTSAPMQPGNSGGPLFSDTGLVIGIAIARLKDEQAENVNFAIKAEEALRFLNRQGIAVKAGSSTKIRQAKEIARDARSFTFPAVCYE